MGGDPMSMLGGGGGGGGGAMGMPGGMGGMMGGGQKKQTNKNQYCEAGDTQEAFKIGGQVIGTAVGMYFGYPGGGQIGKMAGGQIGEMVDPTQCTHRLDPKNFQGDVKTKPSQVGSGDVTASAGLTDPAISTPESAIGESAGMMYGNSDDRMRELAEMMAALEQTGGRAY